VKKFVVLLCLAVGLLFFASGTSAETLGELLPRLIKEHDRVKAAESRLDASKHGVRQAEAGWYPTLDFSGDAGREEIYKATSSDVLTLKHKNTQTLSASQLLYDFGTTATTVEQSEVVLSMTEVEVMLTKQQLLLEGASAYLNVLKANEKLQYAYRSEESIKRQTGIEESLVERGAGLSSDVLQAKQQLAGARALRVITQGELANAINRFKAVFGIRPTPEEMKTFKRPPAPFEALPASIEEGVRAAVKNNPQLRMAKYSMELADKQIALAGAKYYPTFDLFADVKRKENDGGTVGAKNENAAGVKWSWNLYNGGADVAAEKAALSGKTSARYTYLDTQRTVEEQVRTAWDTLLTNRGNSEFLTNQANITGEFLDLARKERKMGTRSLLDVLNAEITYINSISQAVSTEVDTMIAAYNVLFAMGALDTALFQTQ
jgi:TolC family type I secretion outer membrane protein